MIIGRVLNNNVISSVNPQGEEIICMGKGIAFQKKAGDVVDDTLIEKEFVLKDSVTSQQFQQLLQDVPAEEIELVKKIVDYAEAELDVSLSSAIYLNLTDHMHYAIMRAKEGIELPNPLLFETRKFYPKEFRLAQHALEKIEEYFGVSLPESEAGFIAFHIVNAQQQHADMSQTLEATEMVRNILTIISRYFGITLNSETLSYQRIVTHLQYFAQRYLSETLTDEPDEFLFALIQSKYPKAFQAVQRINDFLITRYARPIGESEMIYLTIHIERVVQE
ncbi:MULTISPECIES: BglG family transcription antiterminator LicT [Enterococcus]|uniref:BglG family transcriptional antiterminator n=1 Tax=Enterococcus sulfureus ATCC 49903 TaxID=1140003 RepID=S0KXI0_9ENTE|nr:PRD domain-containing protein [Enterococcus sulfureus]EOT45770.1 BglG family transcriptional antiterminator [Enterococcus sulfureus ATCC 49903]EOT82965.1 BglG family transcriptional antiterminator [Enterococcus sulfureus ATCC 49903]